MGLLKLLLKDPFGFVLIAIPLLYAIIFHELAHRQIYVKGDSAFNEAYASFIGETGVQLWLEATGREARLEACSQRARSGWRGLRPASNRSTLTSRKSRARQTASPS